MKLGTVSSCYSCVSALMFPLQLACFISHWGILRLITLWLPSNTVSTWAGCDTHTILDPLNFAHPNDRSYLLPVLGSSDNTALEEAQRTADTRLQNVIFAQISSRQMLSSREVSVNFPLLFYLCIFGSLCLFEWIVHIYWCNRTIQVGLCSSPHMSKFPGHCLFQSMALSSHQWHAN